MACKIKLGDQETGLLIPSLGYVIVSTQVADVIQSLYAHLEITEANEDEYLVYRQEKEKKLAELKAREEENKKVEEKKARELKEEQKVAEKFKHKKKSKV